MGFNGQSPDPDTHAAADDGELASRGESAEVELVPEGLAPRGLAG